MTTLSFSVHVKVSYRIISLELWDRQPNHIIMLFIFLNTVKQLCAIVKTREVYCKNVRELVSRPTVHSGTVKR